MSTAIRCILTVSLLLYPIHGRNTELEKLLVRYKLNHMDMFASHIAHDHDIYAEDYVYDAGNDGNRQEVQSPPKKKKPKKKGPVKRMIKSVKKGFKEVVTCAIHPFGQKQKDVEAEQMKAHHVIDINVEEEQKKLDAESAETNEEREKMKDWYKSNNMVKTVDPKEGVYGPYIPSSSSQLSLNPLTWVKSIAHAVTQKMFNWEMTLIESMMGPYIIGSKVLLEKMYNAQMGKLRGDFLAKRGKFSDVRKQNFFQHALKEVGATVTHLPQIIWHSFSTLILRSFRFIKDKFAYILLDFYNQVKQDIADSYGIESKPFTLDTEFMKLEKLEQLHEKLRKGEISLPDKPIGEQSHHWTLTEKMRAWSWKLGFKTLDVFMDALRRISRHNLVEWLKKPITTILFPVLDLPGIKKYFTDTVVVLILDYLVDIGMSIAKAIRMHMQKSILEGVAIEFDLETMECVTMGEYETVYEARTKKERELMSYEQLLFEYKETKEKAQQLQQECDELELKKKQLQGELALQTINDLGFGLGHRDQLN